VQAFLSAFAKEHAEEGKRILLVCDGAPAHRAATLNVSESISLLSVPVYRPELNRSERVWPLVKEGVANQSDSSLDELEQRVCARCQKIKAEDVSARTKYHWWPRL
jgi:transposase